MAVDVIGNKRLLGRERGKKGELHYGKRTEWFV
jgi:hypothetical protein